jgi:hypothetical protein
MHQHTRRRFPLRSLVAFAQFGAARFFFAPLGATLLSAALAGCTRSEVSLGSGQGPTDVGSELICGDGTLAGTIVAGTQEQLEALRGCTEINVDLELVGFPGMDLSPLSELRIVRGNLSVGSALPRGSNAFSIPSLAGLEALEQVNSLLLSQLTVPDLSALAGLRSVRHDPLGPRAEGGALEITDCDRLRNLGGLDALSGFTDLRTAENALLESLSGLQVPPMLRSVDLSGATLSDLSALAPLRNVENFVLSDTGVENLDALQLVTANWLLLVNNDWLERADSLSSLQTLPILTVVNNDRLGELPALERTDGLEFFTVVGNAELRSIPSFPMSIAALVETGLYSQVRNSSEGLYGFTLFEVGDNPKLTQIAGMGAASSATEVAIYGNASLTAIDLGVLNSLSTLRIVDNPALDSIQLAQPAQVSQLQVRNNPLLSTAPFAGVQTLSRDIAGNLDAP